jgi:hypothetical protein
MEAAGGVSVVLGGRELALNGQGRGPRLEKTRRGNPKAAPSQDFFRHSMAAGRDAWRSARQGKGYSGLSSSYIICKAVSASTASPGPGAPGSNGNGGSVLTGFWPYFSRQKL